MTTTTTTTDTLTDDELADLLAAVESDDDDAADDVMDRIVDRLHPGVTVIGDEQTTWLRPLIADGIRAEQARRGAATTVPQVPSGS